jgi:ABC-type antimicrobial peptide transport system permease subunit
VWRNKKYSALNFLCLSFGLFCTIIAVIYIKYLFDYDKFHKNYDRLHQVDAFVTFFNRDRFPKELLSASLIDVLKNKLPEAESFTRIANTEGTYVFGDKSFKENGIYADDNFFSSFTFPLIRTNGPNALKELNSIVISESMAMKLFASTDCLGKILIRKSDNREESYKITGIIKDVPAQSCYQFDYIIPFQKFITDNKWALTTGASATHIWMLLKNSSDKNLINEKIRNLIKDQESTLNQELFLFPMKDKILYSYYGNYRERKWTPRMNSVVIIGAIGFVILLIACFNFINTAIALNIKRHREAGIKKIVGSGKPSIIIQFLCETLILTFSSLIMAILLTKLLLPVINTSFNLHLALTEFKIVLISIFITVITSLFSGLLPAIYLASSNPLNVLKGNIITSHSYSGFRKGLIVFQFIIPVTLIVFMMIIEIQSAYMRKCDIGVERDNLIIVNNAAKIRSHSESIKSELLSIPGIDAVSFSNCIPTMGAPVSSEVSWEGKDASEKLDFWCINSDFDYNKVVKIQMTKGRFFNPSFSKDSDNYIINNIAVKILKNNNPLGSILTVNGKKGVIIGIFKNFHVVDLAGPFTPTIIRVNPSGQQNVLIKFSSGTFSSVADKIGKVIRKYDPDGPFTPRLFSGLPNYSNSQIPVPSKLLALGFIIAILLACLGLYGLASFAAESRTKEIGIRKINGATIFSIIYLLHGNYIKMVLIAVLIALPLAFQLGTMFLGRFFFHAAMPLWPYLLGPGIVITIALLTVNSSAWRAATRNPVETLRYE